MGFANAVAAAAIEVVEENGFCTYKISRAGYSGVPVCFFLCALPFAPSVYVQEGKVANCP